MFLVANHHREINKVLAKLCFWLDSLVILVIFFLKGPSYIVNHTFVFVCMREFGYCILFGASRNEGNHCETTKDN